MDSSGDQMTQEGYTLITFYDHCVIPLSSPPALVKNHCQGSVGFGTIAALSVRTIFTAMKNKRMPKAPVPKGLIWWKDEKRHPVNRYVGRVVYRLRTRRGWSLQDLAEAASLGKSYLCELEAGQHSPTLEVQLRLEAAFGLVRGGLLRLAHYAMRRRA